MNTLDPWTFVSRIRRFDKEDLVPIIGITAATSLLYSAYCHLFPKSVFKVKKGTKEIPTPKERYPYIGHFLGLGSFPGQVHLWHQKLGPIFGLHIGVKNWVMINDPKMAYQLFVKNGSHASSRAYTTFGYKHYGIGGRGIIFAQPGVKFKTSRGAALQVLAPKQIDKFVHIIEEESEALVNRLIEATELEGSVFPKNHTSLYSLNVVHAAIFGTRFDRIDHPEFLEKLDQVDEMMRFAGPDNDLSGFLPILYLYDYFLGPQRRMIEYIQNRRDPIYRRSIKKALESKDFNLVKEFATYDLDEEDLIVTVADLIAGGMDTTAITLQWIIPMMCHFVEAQDKARAELDTFVNRYHRLPTFKERNETPYTFALLRECMRFRAVTPFGTPHVTTKDIDVDGYLIPEGSTIFAGMEAMHFNSNNYDDPERFMPERFLGIEKSMLACAQGNIEERDHYNFGWGRRLCPGIYLAENELFASVTKILHRCLIEAHEGLPEINEIPNTGLMSPPIPYRVKIIKRFTSNDTI
ncbi:cytochrome P450 [Pilobolus umbonatus]|nr:cytochrome P450 [Pilobolus umbonatus]